MMHVKKYLKDQAALHGSNIIALQELNKELFIDFKVYDDPNDRGVLLDYNQIFSPKKNPIVRECRSLILDLDTFEVISRSFDRFFNYGEDAESEAKFNWNDMTLFEKADGSLIKVYNLRGRWCISTRGMAFAEGPHPSDPKCTFRDMVLKTFGFRDMESFQKTMDEMCQLFSSYFNQNNTYIFEYTDPLNRVVTPYTKASMVLLCIRDNDNFVEHSFYYCKRAVSAMYNAYGLNVRLVRTYDKPNPSSGEAISKMADQLPGLEEGYVAYDNITGARLKFKSEKYKAAHSAKGNNGPTVKRALLLCFKGDADEFITWFPEYTEFVNTQVKKVKDFLSETIAVYDKNKDTVDKKTFALAVKDYKGSGLIFESRKNNCTILESFEKMNPQAKLRLFMKDSDIDKSED